MLALKWDLNPFFYTIAIPALIAAVAIVLAERTRPRTAEEGAAAGALKPAE